MRFREDVVSVQNARDYNQDVEDDGKLDSYGCKLNEKVCQTDLNQSCLNWLWKGNIQAEITVTVLMAKVTRSEFFYNMGTSEGTDTDKVHRLEAAAPAEFCDLSLSMPFELISSL